jgi:4-coumarate--CoA ligase
VSFLKNSLFICETTTDRLISRPLTMKSTSSETPAALICTSGTTGVGNSKIAIVSHAQLNDSRALYEKAENVFGFIFASFSWITGLGLMVFCALNHEKRLFTRSDFSPDLFFDLMEKFKFSHLTGMPAMYQFLQRSPRFNQADFSCIRQFLVGGINCPIEMRRSITKAMKNAKLTIVYGMTENVTNCVTDEDSLMSLSVGKPFTDTQFKILLPDGSLGNLNETGEILLKRPGKPFLGYVKNEGFTRAALDDERWFHTGDLGFIDDNLNLTIVERKSFVIQRNSKLIFPLEIEEVIEKVPGVKAVCVLGIKGEESNDELPTAFIEKEESSEVTEAIIHDAVKHLESDKQLIGGVFFIETLPRKANGKILRYFLKLTGIEMAKDRIGTSDIPQ